MMRRTSRSFGDGTLKDRLRVFVAKKYLDWAEMLPDFNGGLIAHLQDMRRSQREQSKRCFEQSRQPKGTEFAYPACILMELFPLEEFQTMDRAIRNLFPERRLVYDSMDEFRMRAADLTGFSNYHVGIIAGKRGFFADRVSVEPDLPRGTRYVSIWIHKVLPSTFVLSFDVFLEQAVTTELRRVQDKMYLPTVRFRRWLPIRLGRGERSETPAESAMEGAVFDYLDGVRSGIEVLIRKHFSGYFSRQFRGKGPRLPAIEIFDLNGVSTGEANTDDWLRTFCGWAEPLGLHRVEIEFNGYRDKDMIFVPGEGSPTASPYAHRLLVLGPQGETSQAREERLALLVEGFGQSVLPFVVFLEFLSRIRRTMETLRFRVYRRLTKPRVFANFRNEVRLYNQLQRESLLLNRFAVEFGQDEQFFKRHFRELQSLRAVAKAPPAQDLRETLFAAVRHRLGALQKHVDFILEVFTRHLSTRNMDLTYWLQRQVWIWTVLVTLAAVLTVLGTWPTLRTVLQQILDFLRG